ncbi:hypothetical protein NZNM25_09850 [Nitrosopumilus zosterae]|uniref:Uncharacterized protein n=2 Tax=Nitrosopumilus zosterae TaxID=718286 RepID=A0A2S2KRF8_9ARCH|nr:hypothetical protein NZNM25_09850 [Nitrosopumilus zosterae]
MLNQIRGGEYKIMKVKLTVFVAVLTASLLLAGPSHAFAASSPSSRILAIVPTSVENIHSVIFEVCASDTVNMRAPEVIINSLAEVKNVKLSKVIAKGTCTTNAAQLSAFDPANIKIKVIDKSKLNTMVDQAEKNLIKIKSDISKTNAELQGLLDNIPGNTPTKKDDIAKINDLTSKLSELRMQLKDVRSEYHRLLYILKGN